VFNDNWLNVERILAIRLDNMGDVLMTSPALRALKSLHRNVHLTLLTSSVGAEIARFIPSVDEVLTFDAPWVKHKNVRKHQELSSIIERLQAEKYDAAVIFNTFSQNPLPPALLCYQAMIPRVLAYCRENPYQLMTHWIPDEEPFTKTIEHEVLRQLHLVESIGAKLDDLQLDARVYPEDIAAVHLKLQSIGVDMLRRWLVLHPSASEVRRQYPAEHFISTARQLIGEGWQIVLSGTVNEYELSESICQALGNGCFSLTGKLSLGELIALIDTAPLLISNNSGPVHIAAARQTPVVVLYSLTNPQHTPWQVPHRVLYFDVPEQMRSQNVIIRQIHPRMAQAHSQDAVPNDIVAAVKELV
jgi:lipopolysaccharide heptosyltransferase II